MSTLSTTVDHLDETISLFQDFQPDLHWVDGLYHPMDWLRFLTAQQTLVSELFMAASGVMAICHYPRFA